MGNIKDLAGMIPGVGKAIKDVDIDADMLLDGKISNFLGDKIGLAFDFGLDWKVNDKFNISFYEKVQKGFIKLSNKQKRK